MKTCIVTGGCGFIGSHLIDRLLADGHKVTVIDNLASGNPVNIEHHKDNERLTFLLQDVADHQAIASHFTGVDWVFHLAALADIVPSVQQPLKYHHANVDGTISVLEAARNANVRRFIYAASSSCYGIPDQYPTPETAPIRAEYPYAVTKYLGEEYVRYWGKIYQLPVVSLRFFNVYGPRARTAGTYGAVFGVFLTQKIHGQPFTVVGDGAQTRDFTFVTDAVTACVMAADSNLNGEVMNVGSGNTYSINHLVELLGGKVIHIPKRPGEPDCTFADIAKIQRLLNWRPKVAFEDGVRIMLENIEYWKTAPIWTPEKIAEATKDWFQYLGKSAQ